MTDETLEIPTAQEPTYWETVEYLANKRIPVCGRGVIPEGLGLFPLKQYLAITLAEIDGYTETENWKKTLTWGTADDVKYNVIPLVLKGLRAYCASQDPAEKSEELATTLIALLEFAVREGLRNGQLPLMIPVSQILLTHSA